MSEANVETRTAKPFLKTALVLWILALCGMALVLPYALHIEAKVLAEAAARKGLEPAVLLAISLAQSAILFAIAAFAGLWAARKLGLGAPVIEAWLTRSALPKWTAWTLIFAVLVGVLTAFAIIALNKWVFAPIVPASPAVANPAAWQGLLASFYGGIDEEIMMRLGLLSLLALLFRTIARMFGGSRVLLLPSGAFWTANIVAAVIFGLGHLPAIAAVMHLTPFVVAQAVVLNGIGGIVFGVLYRRFGLEWAMTAHFSADIVLHVVFALG